MNQMPSLRLSFILGLTITLIAFTGSFKLHAQEFSMVKGIVFNGKNTENAHVVVLSTGKEPNKTTVKVGDRFVSGTKLIIPPNTILQLRTPGGTQMVKSIAENYMQYTIYFSRKGEHHEVKGNGAQILNTINKTQDYDYVNSNGRGTYASSKVAIFTFTDNSKENKEMASISTMQGSINILDEVPVQILGITSKTTRRGGQLSKCMSWSQSAGQQEFNSSDAVVPFRNFEQAIKALQEEIATGKSEAEKAANLIGLGKLLIASGREGEAVKAFESAKQICTAEYGLNDLRTLNSTLALTTILGGQQKEAKEQEAKRLLSQTIQLLLQQKSQIEKSMEFTRLEHERMATMMLCENLREVSTLLGWAYELDNDVEQSAAYFDSAEKNCR